MTARIVALVAFCGSVFAGSVTVTAAEVAPPGTVSDAPIAARLESVAGRTDSTPLVMGEAGMPGPPAFLRYRSARR